MKTLIIGAGPSGLNAALHAACEGNEVIVLDKNEKAGKKIYITGKGRCNVTNNSPVNDLIKNVVSNPKFLYSAFNHYNAQDTMKFFEENGVKLVTERGNRVFPESYHASDITKALVKACENKGVKFSFRDKVNVIIPVGSAYEVITTEGKLVVDNIVVATGGLSYPGTGSTGDGYKIAKQFGHTIIEPVTALNSIKIKEEVPFGLNKMIFKNVTLTAIDGKFRHSEFGEMMFDHGTIDGPIVLTLSSLINRRDNSNLQLELDLKSGLDESKLDARLVREINENGYLNVYNFLKNMMPKDFIQMFVEKTNLDTYKKAGELNAQERKRIVTYLKHFPLTYNGLSDIKQGVVTSGGVNVKEIDAKTMESKLANGIYFVGEVLDVDAFTGGFNIQIALSTGALCGDAIKEKINN